MSDEHGTGSVEGGTPPQSDSTSPQPNEISPGAADAPSVFRPATRAQLGGLSPWVQRSLARAGTVVNRPPGLGIGHAMTLSRGGQAVQRLAVTPGRAHTPAGPDGPALGAPPTVVNRFAAGILQRFADTVETPKRYDPAPRAVDAPPVAELPLPGVGTVQRQEAGPRTGGAVGPAADAGEMSLDSLAAMFQQERGGPAAIQREAELPPFDAIDAQVRRREEGGFGSTGTPRIPSPEAGPSQARTPSPSPTQSPPNVQRSAATQGAGFSIADEIRNRIQASAERRAGTSGSASETSVSQPVSQPASESPPSAGENAPAVSRTGATPSIQPAREDAPSVADSGGDAPPVQRTPEASTSGEASVLDDAPELLPISTKEDSPGFSRAAALAQRIQRQREAPRRPPPASTDPQSPQYSRVAALQARIQRVAQERRAAGEAPARAELPASPDPASQIYSRSAEIAARIQRARAERAAQPPRESEPQSELPRDPDTILRMSDIEPPPPPPAPIRQDAPEAPAATPPAATPPPPVQRSPVESSAQEIEEAGGSVAAALRARIEAAKARRSGETPAPTSVPTSAPASGDAGVQRAPESSSVSPPPQSTAAPSPSVSGAEADAGVGENASRVQRSPAGPDAPGPDAGVSTGSVADQIRQRIQAKRDADAGRTAAASPPAAPSSPPAGPSAPGESGAPRSGQAASRVDYAGSSSLSEQIQRARAELTGEEPTPIPPQPRPRASGDAVQRSPDAPPPPTDPNAQVRPVRQGVLKQGDNTPSWQKPAVQRTRMYSRTEILTPERKQGMGALARGDADGDDSSGGSPAPAGGARAGFGAPRGSETAVQRSPDPRPSVPADPTVPPETPSDPGPAHDTPPPTPPATPDSGTGGTDSTGAATIQRTPADAPPSAAPDVDATPRAQAPAESVTSPSSAGTPPSGRPPAGISASGAPSASAASPGDVGIQRSPATGDAPSPPAPARAQDDVQRRASEAPRTDGPSSNTPSSTGTSETETPAASPAQPSTIQRTPAERSAAPSAPETPATPARTLDAVSPAPGGELQRQQSEDTSGADMGGDSGGASGQQADAPAPSSTPEIQRIQAEQSSQSTATPLTPESTPVAPSEATVQRRVDAESRPADPPSAPTGTDTTSERSQISDASSPAVQRTPDAADQSGASAAPPSVPATSPSATPPSVTSPSVTDVSDTGADGSVQRTSAEGIRPSQADSGQGMSAPAPSGAARGLSTPTVPAAPTPPSDVNAPTTSAPPSDTVQRSAQTAPSARETGAPAQTSVPDSTRVEGSSTPETPSSGQPVQRTEAVQRTPDESPAVSQADRSIPDTSTVSARPEAVQRQAESAPVQGDAAPAGDVSKAPAGTSTDAAPVIQRRTDDGPAASASPTADTSATPAPSTVSHSVQRTPEGDSSGTEPSAAVPSEPAEARPPASRATAPDVQRTPADASPASGAGDAQNVDAQNEGAQSVEESVQRTPESAPATSGTTPVRPRGFGPMPVESRPLAAPSTPSQTTPSQTTPTESTRGETGEGAPDIQRSAAEDTSSAPRESAPAAPDVEMPSTPAQTSAPAPADQIQRTSAPDAPQRETAPPRTESPRGPEPVGETPGAPPRETVQRQPDAPMDAADTVSHTVSHEGTPLARAAAPPRQRTVQEDVQRSAQDAEPVADSARPATPATAPRADVPTLPDNVRSDMPEVQRRAEPSPASAAEGGEPASIPQSTSGEAVQRSAVERSAPESAPAPAPHTPTRQAGPNADATVQRTPDTQVRAERAASAPEPAARPSPPTPPRPAQQSAPPRPAQQSAPTRSAPEHLFDRLQRVVKTQIDDARPQVMRKPDVPSRTADTPAPAAATTSDSAAAAFVSEQDAASRFLLQLERKAQTEAVQMGRGPLIQRLIDPRLLASGKSKSLQRASKLGLAVLPQARNTVQRKGSKDVIQRNGKGKQRDDDEQDSLLSLSGPRTQSQQSPRSSGDQDAPIDENFLSQLPSSLPSQPTQQSSTGSPSDQQSINQLVKDSLDTVSAFTGNRPRNFQGGGSSSSDGGPNLDEIARQILPLIRRMLAIERERRPSR